MERDEIRKVVTAQFYQSLAESGVQIDAIPTTELQAIVNALADSIFAAFDALEEEGSAMGARPRNAATPAMDEPPEEVLWQGRPYLTIGVRYELTTQRIRIIRGILGKNIEEIELVRVRDTKVKQHLGERALNVGDITIFSTDPTTPELVLHNVKNPVEVRELIRKAALEEKNRRGLHYREEM